MTTVTKQESLDKLLANNYRAITILETVDHDGQDEDIYLTVGYVAKEDKHVPFTILKHNMDMYDFLYILEY